MDHPQLHRLKNWLIFWRTLYYLGWLTFASFGVISMFVLKGCDALLHGHIQAGHYYLGDGKSGNFFFEVSPAVYYYSEWHMILAFVLWPIAFIVATIATKIVNNNIAALKEANNVA